MGAEIAKLIDDLKTLPLSKLIKQYEEVVGKTAIFINHPHLIRQFAYKIQENVYCKMKPEITDKIADLISLYNPINRAVIRTQSGKTESGRDVRLPIPGSVITKRYKGKRLEVKILENGFEYEGFIYKNLSAVACAITGSHWNGFIFFGIKQHERRKRS